MDIIKKIKLECVAVPLVFKGVPHQIGRYWFNAMNRDWRLPNQEYSRKTVKYWHRKGYLVSSIKRWNLADKSKCEYISDFEYKCLSPINSSFSKWLTDMLTTQRVMLPANDHFRNVYFSIIQREKKKLILRIGHEDRQYTIQDVIDFVREKGQVELRPSWWNSRAERYILSYESNNDYLLCNGEQISKGELEELINEFKSNYVVSDVVDTIHDFGKYKLDHSLKFWITNDYSDGSKILASEISIYTYNLETDEKEAQYLGVDLDSGTFTYQGDTISIPEWDELRKKICSDASLLQQLSFYTASVAVGENNSFIYLVFSGWPRLPEDRFNEGLDSYLKEKYLTQFKKKTFGEQLSALARKICTIERRTMSRKGMRTYMYGLWRAAARNDLLKTKGVSLPQKLWAHRHGFFSWRLYQYGLTKDNYSQFLSDYDYYWLNRINNHYQLWVNDKTTFRYVMEPFKQFVPKYYFSVYRRSGEVVISKMRDCPLEVSDGFDGVIEMLRQKGRLAFKASAGTHGDGFYCLAYENGTFYANGEALVESDLQQLIEGMKSFYVVTEYIEMHSELKRIYDKSVNTVRMMVVNDHGFDPRILQTYMRIGSEKSGYTDNVGYGGICVFVNKETGELYKPETIKNHVFYDCPVHPDTGTAIEGILPNWEVVKNKILEISRYLSELEYLGFDIAITEDGFKILEINIHQDLHKVASFDREINDYFKRKIDYKYETLTKKRNILGDRL